MKRTVVTALTVLVLIGCGSARSRPTTPHAQGESTPQKTFEIVNEALRTGDLDTAYEYISTGQKQGLTLATFKEQYRTSREDWLLRIEGAHLQFVAPDDTEGAASAYVIWGDGSTGVVTFTLEGKTWKEDTFYPVKGPFQTPMPPVQPLPPE